MSEFGSVGSVENVEDDEDDENELSGMMKMDVMHLAALFYQTGCRTYQGDLDFSTSNHPEEQRCWNEALIAYAVIRKEDWFLQFQVV